MLLLGLFLWRTVLPAARAETYAFSAYYTSARLTLAGQGGAAFCSAWFFEQQRALGFGERADYFCPNPPTTALLMLPVAWLPPVPARYAWVALDVVMTVGIVWLAWQVTIKNQELRTENRGATVSSGLVGSWFSVLGSPVVLAALVVLLFKPLHADLHAGQVYTLLALLYALWLYGWAAGRDRLCGTALAGLALAKLAGWPLWLLALAGRRWRALGWALGLGALGGALSLPLLGLNFWLLYMRQQVPAISADPVYAAPAFQTLASMLRQIFVYNAQWSPAPLIDLPWLAGALWWALALGLLAATLLLARRGPLRAGMAGLCLVVPLQPAGEEYHYTLLLGVVLVLLWGMARGTLFMLGTASQEPSTQNPEPARPRLRSVLGARCLVLVLSGCALLCLPAYFLNIDAWMGWPRALLAYPRMAGALLIWAALVCCWRGRDVVRSA